MPFSELAERSALHRTIGLCVHCTNEAEPERVACYAHLKYSRDFHRERRKERRAKGLCIRCEEPGKIKTNGLPSLYCPTCAVKGNAAAKKSRKKRSKKKRMVYCTVPKKKRRALGLCVRCGSPNERKTQYCLDCSQEDSTNRMELITERRIQGKCFCGRSVKTEFTTCHAHRRKNRSKQRIARSKRRAEGLCRTYGCQTANSKRSPFCLAHKLKQRDADQRRARQKLLKQSFLKQRQG